MEVDENPDSQTVENPGTSISSENEIKTKESNNLSLDDSLGLLRRFQLYGTELSIYTGSKSRSISSWLSLEKSNKYRLWNDSFFLKSVQQLDKIIAKSSGNQAELPQINAKIKTSLVDNVSSAAPFTNPFIVAQFSKYVNTRSMGAVLFPYLIRSSEDILLFNKFYGKKGNTKKLQAAIYNWYCDKVNNEADLMDLLLNTAVMGWTHRHVFKWWHLPIEKNTLHRVICGDELVNLETLGDERRKFVEKCLQIRNMSTAKQFLEFFAQRENVTTFRSWILRGLTSQSCSEVSMLEAIKIIDIHQLIEMIPKIFNRFPNNTQLVQEIVHRLCQQCKEPEASVTLNPLPLFLIPRWLDFKIRNRLMGRKQREPASLIKDRVSRLFTDAKVEQIENLVFILDLEVPQAMEIVRSNDGNDGDKLNLRRNQDIKRPAVMETVVKPLEFVAFLLEKYHNHKVFHNSKLIHLKGNVNDIYSSLTKLEHSVPSMWPLNYNNVIVVTLNKPFPRFSDNWLQKFDKLRMLRISVVKQEYSKVSTKSNHYFTINGLDSNILEITRKYFSG